jgi:enoyl-CoA hydratase
MAYENIVTNLSGGIFTIVISRPQALNVLNTLTLKELDGVIGEAEAAGEVKALIITGAGEKAFVAGADITEVSELSTLAAREMTLLGQRVFSRVEELGKPVIAAVNGYALGGGNELAMSCDIRVASENATFGQPEVNLGIIPSFGGTQRLPRLVGRGMAKYLIMTGEMIGAAEALRIGLVDKVVPQAELMDQARAIARLIMKKPPIAVLMAKRAIDRGLDMDLSSGMSYEAEAYTTSFSTSDRMEGMKAFLAKREATFSGR